MSQPSAARLIELWQSGGLHASDPPERQTNHGRRAAAARASRSSLWSSPQQLHTPRHESNPLRAETARALPPKPAVGTSSRKKKKTRQPWGWLSPASGSACSARKRWSRSVCKSTSVSGAPDNSSPSHFSAMMWPQWLSRAVRNGHRHAIEQASRRWRGGRRGDSGRTRREI